MTTVSPNALGYQAVRTSVGMYENSSAVFRVSGDDTAAVLLYILARSTEYSAAGAVFDSLILNEDGSVHGLVTLIWGEDDVLVLAEDSLNFADILAAAKQSLELEDVTVTEITDTMKIVWFEGPLSWKVTEKFYDGDVAQIQFSTFIVADDQVAGGETLIGRHGSTGEFGYFVAVESPTENLLALVEEVVTELQGATVTPAALRRAQLEMHHPVLPEQAAGATVREASLTWQLSAMREDDFLGSANWNSDSELARGTISVTCPAGTLPEIGTPVLAGDVEIGHICVVAEPCGEDTDLGKAIVELPFNVPNLELSAAGVELKTVAAPTRMPASWNSTVGDLA